MTHGGNVAKLADFGCVRFMSSQSSVVKTRRGTVTHFSPELIKGDFLSTNFLILRILFLGSGYNTKTDIWSFGCVWYELCCLCVPFYHIDPETDKRLTEEQIFDKIESGDYQAISENDYSKRTRDLIGQCLELDPQKRPTANDILKRMNDYRYNLDSS